jgi:NAD(P)-dependent dehydrogenase (short-subunit alcohol dehydrogenase family)
MATGATTGLGLGAACQLLQPGSSTLVLAVRAPRKGIVARDALLADSIVRKVNPLAPASHDSVISFVDKITGELPELHVLLLNGGA